MGLGLSSGMLGLRPFVTGGQPLAADRYLDVEAGPGEGKRLVGRISTKIYITALLLCTVT